MYTCMHLVCVLLVGGLQSLAIFHRGVKVQEVQNKAGVSLRIEVAGGYYKMTGESGHSEKKLTSSFYRLMKFSRKIPCSSRRILRSPMLNEHPDKVYVKSKLTLIINLLYST